MWVQRGHPQTEKLMTIHINVHVYTLGTLEEREGNYLEENSVCAFPGLTTINKHRHLYSKLGLGIG